MVIDYSKIYDVDMCRGDAHKAIKAFSKGDRPTRRNFLDQSPANNHYSLLAYLSNQINDGIIVEVGTYFGTGTIALANNPSNRVITYDILPTFQAAVLGFSTDGQPALPLEQIEKAKKFAPHYDLDSILGEIDRNFLPLNIEIMVKEDGDALGENEVIVTTIDEKRECTIIRRDNDPNLLLKSNLLFVDAAHDGIMEKQIYDFLCENNYKGILLLDDISLNKEMAFFWQNIDKKKYDITEIGNGIGGTLWRSGTGLVDFSDNVEIIRPTTPPAFT
jgi:hypothetical protein